MENTIENAIRDEVNFLEQEQFIKNEHGQYIYISKDGAHTISLAFILSDYKDFLIQNKILRQKY